MREKEIITNEKRNIKLKREVELQIKMKNTSIVGIPAENSARVEGRHVNKSVKPAYNNQELISKDK